MPAFEVFGFVALWRVGSSRGARRDARLNMPLGLLFLPRDFVAVKNRLSTLALNISLQKCLKFPVDGDHVHEVSFVADALLGKAGAAGVQYLTAHLVLGFAIFVNVVIARRKKFEKLMRVVVAYGIVEA